MSKASRSQVSDSEVVRWAIESLRGETRAFEQLRFACLQLHNAGDDGFFSSVTFSTLVRCAAARGTSLRMNGALDALEARRARLDEENRSVLRRLGAELPPETSREGPFPVLLGDGAVLAGLYGDFGAFAATLWVAGETLPAVRGRFPSLTAAVQASGGQAVVTLGQLAPLVDEHCHPMTLDGRTWLVPQPELLVTLLAARLGDPLARPFPPVWPHLGLALGVFRAELDLDEVRSLGAELEMGEQVERGLLLAGRVLPQLRTLVASKVPSVPAWERILALPIAAHRLLAFSHEGRLDA